MWAVVYIFRDDDSDAVVVDAPTDAAPTDMATDMAPPPPYSATVSITETAVLNPGTGLSFFGQGITIVTSFTETATAVAPVFDQMPGTPFGCKVFVFDTPQELATVSGVNEGAVQVTVDNPASGPPDPTFPACIYAGAATGYICPDFGSSQSPGATTTSITATENVVLATMTPGATATMTLSATSAATFGAEDVGRYVKFAGTGNPGTIPLDAATNAFPIVGIASNKIAVIGLPLPAATTVPVTQGTFTALGGQGPLPMFADPGMLDDMATVSINAIGNANGGGNHLGNWTMSTGAGDDFTITDTIANLMRNIPLNGNAFTIECDSTGTPSNCGVSVGTVLNIVTTDGSLTGITSPFAMPSPATKRVNIRCAAIGPTSITVPAQASAHLMTSGATRIQTTLIRGNLGSAVPANPAILPVVGHAITAFTTPP